MKRTKILLLFLLLTLLFSIFTITAYADDYFILNTESGKFHRRTCDYLPSSDKRERIDAYELDSELERYSRLSPSPCKHCNPLNHIGDEYEEYDDSEETDESKLKWGIFSLVVFVILAIIAHYHDKWKKAGPVKGRGLTGVAKQYHSKIAWFTQSLPKNTRERILAEAYNVITKYQKAYNPANDSLFEKYLFSDEYDNPLRAEIFAVCFLLCNRIRLSSSDEFGSKMADAYNESLKTKLAGLYDYCYLSGEYFPGVVVDCFCSDGYDILMEYSQYFKQNHK